MRRDDLLALQHVFARHDGMATTAALKDADLGDRAISRLVASGSIVRLRRGVFADGSRFADAGPEGRHLLRVRAEAMAAVSALVFSHTSAAVIHGLPLIGARTRPVEVADPGATSGGESRERLTHRGGPPMHPVTVGGLRVTSFERTVVNLAASQPFASGLTVVDAALRGVVPPSAGAGATSRSTTKERLLSELDHVAPRIGYRRARRAIVAGDAKSESAGESLSRARMIELGFEAPELQVKLGAGAGAGAGDEARVDFFWRRIRIVGEFDGMVKYSRSHELSGLTPAEVVIREKRREDRLRRTVNGFVRWTWADAIAPQRFHRLLAEAGVPMAR